MTENTTPMKPKPLVCDFCSRPEIAGTVYGRQVATFGFRPLIGHEHLYSEDWAACSTCLPLAQRGDWDQLAENATTAHGVNYSPSVRAKVVAACRALYASAFEDSPDVIREVQL